jgi:hypothetical protein
MRIVKIDDNTFHLVNFQEEISVSDLEAEAAQLSADLTDLGNNPPTSTELRNFALSQHPHYQLIDEKTQRLEYLTSMITRLNNIINTYTER